MGRRILRWVVGTVALLLLLVVAAAALLDTAPGHRFLASRIANLQPSSGLRIAVDRIDGSLYGLARIKGLRLYDTRGLFFSAPQVTLDWRPSRWLTNKLWIYLLQSDEATLARMPVLRPGKPGPLLPKYDIFLDRLSVGRLRLGEPLGGGVARIEGRGDVRHGRALVRLSASADKGGDRLALLIDAESDRNRLDLDATLTAPAGGVIGHMLGTNRPIALRVSGDGTWTTWRGRAVMNVSGLRIVDLQLSAAAGKYKLGGLLAPAPITQGKKARLTAPRVLVSGEAQLADRQLKGSLTLRSPAVSLRGAGTIDLARSRFDALKIDGELLRPPALFPNMTGHDVHFAVQLDGALSTPDFRYLITAPHVAFDNTGFDVVEARGAGVLRGSQVAVPLDLRARRVTGVGEVAGGILANLHLKGTLAVTSTLLTGTALAVTSDKLTGKLDLRVDLITGAYNIIVTGQLARYFIPGLGIVDVLTELKAVPGPGGHGTVVTGRGHAWVRRFDNAFLRSLAGGLPEVETGLLRRPDGAIDLIGLKLKGPSITLTGNGQRRRDGTFQITASGRQARYGPLKLVLDGKIDRPTLDVALERPMDALGLAQVRAHLDPTVAGFDYRATGGSRLGPFKMHGAIDLPQGERAVIRIAALDVAGTTASGSLRADPEAFTGQLTLTGGGIDGTLAFAPLRGVQAITAHLALKSASLAGPPPLLVKRGKVDGVIVFDADGASIGGTASASGIRRGNFTLARLQASANLKGGRGTVKAHFAGPRGGGFAFDTVAEVTPGKITINGGGMLDRRPVVLFEPAVLTYEGGGWTLASTALSFAGGKATVDGHYGNGAGRIDAKLEGMPLSVLDIGWPRLGLGGVATGSLSFTRSGPGALPQGRADLKIRALTRAGLVLASKPADVAIAAVLSGQQGVARAVFAGGGKVIGRAQARFSPIPANGDLVSRLLATPIFAQLRYDGPADSLWRLTGVESIDLSGPVAIGADFGGRLGDPVIRGSFRATGAHFESALTGTVVSQLSATGSFAGSKLNLDSFSGSTGKAGTLSGRGSFDLAAANGFGIDLSLNAQGARMIELDTLGATVTGPMTIKSDGSGGQIAGTVTLDKGRYTIGKTAAAEVTKLPVKEINRAADEEIAEEPRPKKPWLLAIKARARNQLMVVGMGLDSEWRANLDVGGNVAEPEIQGTATLVRGTYEFAGRRFDLTRGTIRFPGGYPNDPQLDITAEASVTGLSAVIRVTGTGLKPEIAFTSIPALPEDELLARLLFGTSITNLSAPEALQLAAAVASLRSGGGNLNPLGKLRKAVGVDRIRILPADATTGQKSSVAVGKYIRRRVYVEVATDGQGRSSTQIEVELKRWLSILSQVSTRGRTSASVKISKDY
jgi:translocation and assembly module TamB